MVLRVYDMVEKMLSCMIEVANCHRCELLFISERKIHDSHG